MKFFPLIFVLSLLACADSSTYSDPETTTESKVLEDETAVLAPNPLEPVNDNMAVPNNWSVNLDDPNTEPLVHANSDSTNGIFFVNMKPGWHITTGPAAIFSHPGLSGSDEFKAETAIHLFDPGQRKESFGLFLGGQNLDNAERSYDYFLIRQGGEFLIKRRSGEETSTMVPWTSHEAIMSFTEASQSSELNVISVEVLADSVHFAVNEVRVASLAAEEVNTDGLVGLRVNHALNLHVSDVSVK